MLQSKSIIKANQKLMTNLQTNVYNADNTIFDISKIQDEASELSKQLNKESNEQMLQNQ